ncbi:MAG: H-NS histone family protein, partial [Burkholderiaceae bacterium]|nr:H-NS histone family protein [Burkholderiaceae bacterium]
MNKDIFTTFRINIFFIFPFKGRFMTQQNYTNQQAKIQKEIERLHKQAQLLQSKQRKPVISGILRSMKEYGITPDEIA